MTLTFLKRLTTTTLAAAVALTGLAAAPARASSDDLVKVLVGVTGIYIVSEALKGNHKNNRDNHSYRPAPQRRHSYDNGYRQDSYHRRDAYGHNRAADVRRDGYRFDRFDRHDSRKGRFDHFDNHPDRGDRFRDVRSTRHDNDHFGQRHR